jgi:predicted RNA binding protein YcfA (HicA-like mRNA interferase family)
MRLPRNWDGEDLIRSLTRIGYVVVRQSGSHVRLTVQTPKQEHHITVPLHSPMRIGTLNQILTDVAAHLEISKDELIRRLL